MVNSSANNKYDDRAAGVLLGLACGDALGRPVEFKTAQDIQQRHGQVTDMLANGTWGQPAGTITDDTDQALCIARSLVKQNRFDPADIADRFVNWRESEPFDIGGMTRRSISQLQRGVAWDQAGKQVWEESPEGQNAGNGSVMRCAPLAIAYADDPDMLIQTSIDSSWITHADPRCSVGCAVVNLTIAALLNGNETPLEDTLARLTSNQEGDSGQYERILNDANVKLDGILPIELRDALTGIPSNVDESSLQTSGYVVHTVKTALYDALTADSAEDALITAVNRGGDTDTIGAVTGAIAGARFGAESLPARWLEVLDVRDELKQLSHQLASYH